MAQSDGLSLLSNRRPYRVGRNGIVPAVPDEVTPGAVRVGQKAAANFLGISEQALSALRRRGTGPAWYYHMSRIAYDVAALKEYAEKGAVNVA